MFSNIIARSTAAIAALAAAGAAHGAIVTYDNFGPGFSYSTGTSTPIGGFLGPPQRAQRFTASNAGPLTDVYLGIFNVFSASNITVRIAEFTGGAPQLGDVLESWSLPNLPGSSGGPVTHLVSQDNPMLDAGQEYWLWIQVGGTGTVGWGFSPDASLNVPTWTNTGGASSGRPGALRVDVIPTPAAATLLGIGALTLARRRR